METKLTRIAEIAGRRPRVKLQTLIHAIDAEHLKVCHEELKADKATGVDEVTKQEYGAKLRENIADLLDRMKRQAYKPQPVRRVYIPKAEGQKLRPLGIPAYEDKLVQKALNNILVRIYEGEFLNSSYGYRPGRGCHEALRMVGRILETGRINYVVEADIKGFFDHVDHAWMMKFLGERIADPNVHRLILRFLKAGVMEDGRREDSEQGTPQGGVISPTLANVYLHYVLDLWFAIKVAKQCQGQAYLIRYADDFLCFFENQEEAETFLQGLPERLGKFGLEVAPEKTKLIEFGRNAAENRTRRGKGKPETFDFLGFTHYCGKSRNGRFCVKRMTSRKKFKAKVKACGDWLHKMMHCPVQDTVKALNQKLIGHYQYYGVTWNSKRISLFRYLIRRKLFTVLNRRSQKLSLTWEEFARLEKQWPLARSRIYVNLFG